MDENISTIRNGLKSSFEDFIVSRKERGELRRIVTANYITEHQRKVLLSEARAMAVENADSHKGVLLLDWLYEVFKILNDSGELRQSKPHVYFSPGTACQEAICSQIRFTNKRIRICVFTISDDEITEELLAAHRRGVSVSIITDDDKAFDKGSDIQRLEKSGLDIITDRSPVHMHHKFALFDDDTVLTGSYNWTRSAATHNYENIAVLKNPEIFKSYKKEFERLWKKLH